MHAPVLAINSEAFMYWESNFDVVHHVAKEAMDQDAPAWVLTVKGTIHISQSDFALLYPGMDRSDLPLRPTNLQEIEEAKPVPWDCNQDDEKGAY